MATAAGEEEMEDVRRHLPEGAELFVCEAASAITIQLVRTPEQVVSGEGAFSPEFTHQVVGQSETIFGYRNLSVELLYRCDDLLTCLSISYDQRAPRSLAEPDDVQKMVAEWLPAEGWMTNKDQFCAEMAKPVNFTPPGELVTSYQTSASKSYEIYLSTIETPGMVQYHERLQTFAIWFIEGGQFIDLEDDKWMVLTLFEKDEHDGVPRYAVAGFLTMYRYYAFPANTRPRISQVVILPPFQRKGHGARLLQAAYDQAKWLPDVVDIAVEDPAPQFSRLRDFVDCRNCLSCTPVASCVGDCERFIKAAQRQLKLNRIQARRVYEILHLRAIDRSDKEQMRQYRLLIKKRLIQPFLKEKSAEERQLKSMTPPEQAFYHAAQQEFRDQLQESFMELKNEYMHIIEKLDSARD